MKQNYFFTENAKQVTNSAKNAVVEVKNAKRNLMYYINTLNKLARKNEYCDAVNVREFGAKVREYAKAHEIDIKDKDYFCAYLFTNVNGIPCYKKTTHKKACESFAVDVDIITWQPVTLSEIGVLNAFKYILRQEAAKLDKENRAKNKEIRKQNRKQENAEKASARKTLRQEQENARKEFAAGKMCIEEFAKIMAKVA